MMSEAIHRTWRRLRGIGPASRFCGLLLLTALASCSSRPSVIDDHLGLYAISESSCEVPQDAFDPCASTRYLEIVRGRFSGVQDDQLAYVFWSGEPAQDPALQYSATPIAEQASRAISKDRFQLTDDADAQEYLLFTRGRLTEYHASYAASGRTIHYKLEALRRSDLQMIRLDYPSAD